MTETALGLLAAALLVSLAHGALPNHWAPFVLIGRAQGWTARKMLWVLSMAGVAHLAVAGGLALAMLLLGHVVTEFMEAWAHVLPGAILLTAGVIYVVIDLVGGRAHAHHHDVHDAAGGGMSDRSATATLVLTLALSPCEAMIPVFVGATPMGDPIFLAGLVVLSGIVSLALMAVLALLSWHGVRRLTFGWFAHHERLTMGAILVLVGLLTLILGHAHHDAGH
jgi:hypothetical protein